jgi:hypothetical protein
MLCCTRPMIRREDENASQTLPKRAVPTRESAEALNFSMKS